MLMSQAPIPRLSSRTIVILLDHHSINITSTHSTHKSP